MTSFYRSDSVSHYNLVIPRESAWDIMNKLGNQNVIQDKQDSFILYQTHLHFWVSHSLLKLRDVTKIY